MTPLKRMIPILVLLLGSGAAVQVQALNDLQLQQQGEVSYISGGVGEEERSQLEALSGQFNLKVVLALEEGNYLSDVNLELRDVQGNTVISTLSKGPWFYAALPPGDYTLVVGLEDNSQQRQVSVPDTGQREVTVTW